jgi:hypothetical protein
MDYTENMNHYVCELNAFKKDANNLNTELLVKELKTLKDEFNSTIIEFPRCWMSDIELRNYYKIYNFNYITYNHYYFLFKKI